jgi:hypothetical protein
VDWHRWYRDYDADTPLARRLAIVQARLRDVLPEAPTRRVRLISICAGDARDVVGALAGHPAAGSVSGRLVELDPSLAAVARERVAEAGLTLEVVEADAGWTDAYVGATPADVLLVCGVFGNISDEDVHGTIEALPSLLASGAAVIWTRHRRPPDLTPVIRAWFWDAGFEEVSFEHVPGGPGTVGVSRYRGRTQPLFAGRRLFTFTGTE